MREYLDRDLNSRTTTRDQYSLKTGKGVVHEQFIAEYANTTLIETTKESGYDITDPIVDAVNSLITTISNVNATASSPNNFSMRCNNLESPNVITLKEDVVIQRVSFMSFVDYDAGTTLVLILDIGTIDQKMISEITIGQLGVNSISINEDDQINYTGTDRTITVVINGNTNVSANGLLTVSYYKTEIE